MTNSRQKQKQSKDTRLDRHSADPKTSAYGNKSGVKGGAGQYNWERELAPEKVESITDVRDPMFCEEKDQN
ncbi:hypothetical protein RS030_172672 [Cryptosporidium xiaoi]|uniref:Hyaluronan/mRNA-binding protein domain-containing protein n=1 Tax=Cryptosporidium xiaoi TaxID=659607 RepID=A0AAV9Y0H2_9CRYT